MKQVVLVFLVLILGTPNLQSQSKKQSKKQTRSERVNISEDLILNLNNGALLVRISKRQRVLNALSGMGNEKKLQRYKQRLNERNRAIIGAFRGHFDFCPVYFFYSDESKYVIRNQIDSITFLNDSLVPDPSIKMEKEFFLVAEFTNIEQDTTSRFEDNYIVSTSNGPEVRSTYSGGMEVGFPALVIKNNQFTQLRKPFPYYSKSLDFLKYEKKFNRAARRVNYNLIEFYNQTLKKTN